MNLAIKENYVIDSTCKQTLIENYNKMFRAKDAFKFRAIVKTKNGFVSFCGCEEIESESLNGLFY